MVKNKTGGNKAKSKARKGEGVSLRLDDLIKDDEQAYGVITHVLGGGRCRVDCIEDDGSKVSRLGIGSGRLRRGPKMKIGCAVLISKRDFQDEKCDILHVYSNDEVRMLKNAGELKDVEVVETDDADVEFKDEDWGNL